MDGKTVTWRFGVLLAEGWRASAEFRMSTREGYWYCSSWGWTWSALYSVVSGDVTTITLAVGCAKWAAKSPASR